MIIGGKRKEEVIKTKRWGMFNDGIHEHNPIALKVSKRWDGRWEIWEMCTDIHGTTVGAYRTKKEAIAQAEKISKQRNLPVK